jgi:Lsr2
VIVAQHVDVKLVDDLDGSEATETVSFGLDGRQFEIDLSTDNAAQLRAALASFVAAARRGEGGGRRRSAGSRPKPAGAYEDTSAIRDWARSNGHEVSDRGRISKSIMDAYNNRNAVAEPEAPAAQPKKSRKRMKVAS